MFIVNDDLSIYATRGDIVCLNVSATDDRTGEPYEFQPGDILQMKIFVKKDAESVVLQKDFPVPAKTNTVGVFLTEQDTRIGDVISKPTDYWYEVTLNPYTNPQTFIGYDEDGAKIFKLFPEGNEVEAEDEPVKPEDIPVVDEDLSLLSSRPVENKAIARAITLVKNDMALMDERLSAAVRENKRNGKELTERFNNLIAMEDPSLSQNLEYLDFITEETKAKIDAHIETDGVFAKVKVNLREANLIYGGTELEVFVVPAECRPVEVGLIHTEDGLEYRIKYDDANKRYVMSLKALSSVSVAPSGAGTVNMSYALGDYELKDIRLGSDGKVYGSAGEAVRAQIANVSAIAEVYITPQMFGAKCDGVSDDTAAFNNAVAALGEGASVLLIPNGTYRITGQVNISNKNGVKILGEGCPVISVQSQDEVTAAFYITDYNSVEVSGIKFVSARDKAGTPPKGHIRADNYTSNIHAIWAERGDTLACRDNVFENMESDYWIVGVENRNVTIDGWLSFNASMPMYATYLYDGAIRNAKLKPARGMGAGDHCFYISTLSDNVLVEDVVMEAPDDCFGNLISFYDAHNETDESLQPKSITFRNVKARGCRLFVGNVFANLTLDNVDYEQTSDHYATSIGGDGTVGYTEIGNHVSGAKNLIVRGGRVKCSTGDFFEEKSGYGTAVKFVDTEFDVSGRLVAANMSTVLIKSCEVVCKTLFHSSGGTDSLRVELRNSKVQTSGDYLLSRRNNNSGTVLLIGNHFVCTASAARKIVYHGATADSAGIKFLGNFFYNYKNVEEKDSENLVMLDNYNNDVAFN